MSQSNDQNINSNPNNNNNQSQQPQNLTASSIITTEITNVTNQNDVYYILNTQTEILSKQYETNNALQHFNEYSTQKYNQLANDFEKHTKMLKEMKKDLEYINKKTRNLQNILNEKFPNIGVEQTNYKVEDD